MEMIREYWSALGAMEFGGNTVRALLLAIGLFLAIFVVLRVVMGMMLVRLKKIAAMTAIKVDDVFLHLLSDVGIFSYASVALYFAARPLNLPEYVDTAVFAVFLVTVMYQGIRIAENVLVFVVQKVWFRGRGAEGENVWSVLLFVIRAVLWSVAALLFLSNLGFNVTSLVASLGIGGVAIALAVQNILSDLFSSFSLYMDEPFKKGDFIITGDHAGTVKKIGLKTTRIQALQGEEIVIPNQELTNSRVRNYKRMDTRRIEFGFGIAYETPPEKIEKLPVMIREIFANIEKARLDRAHFKSFGDFSLNIEVIYIVQTSDYHSYMDIQQQVNLDIMRACHKEGITFAYPTQTVHLVTPAASQDQKNRT